MELIKGYKQTEVGFIPSDWNLEELGNCLLNRPKYGIGAAASSYNDTLPTYLRITDISEDGKFIHENKSSVNHTNSHEYILENGEIVFARTGASVGKSYLYNKSDGILIYAGFLIKVKPDPSKLNSYFLKNIVTTKHFWNWIGMVSMRSGQPGINSSQLSSFILPIPSLEEQTAIANALSDADAYITSIEKLIEKKHQIKQGAMQELLKPKDGWEIKKLGEIADIYTGKKNNQDKILDGDYPFFVRSQTIERINSYSFDGEAILIPGEGNIGKIFHYIHGKFDFHQRVYKISNFSKGYFGKYIYRYISEYFGAHAMENTVKATVDSLRLPTFQIFKIPFPPSYEEQVSIAQILSEIDEDIMNSEKKLEKIKSIKKGMMQNLLTGKIRLI
jgi:type I restriction enzyme S subunit